MFVLESTHARVVADLKSEIAGLNARLNVEKLHSARLTAEIATLRKGGPRGDKGRFTKRANG